MNIDGWVAGYKVRAFPWIDGKRSGAIRFFYLLGFGGFDIVSQKDIDRIKGEPHYTFSDNVRGNCEVFITEQGIYFS